MSNKKESKEKCFALIGCGRIAQTHKDALLATNGCKIIAVADTSESKVKAMAEECRCRGYSDYRELADIPELDGVIIAIPPNEHYKCASFFIDRGVHVICEKPITLQSDQARSLLDQAEQKDVVLMMAAKFRYVRDIVKAKSIIESGILGEIIHIENTFCAFVDMTSWWNSDPAISGGGVLMDNGCHSVDIIRYLTGPIKKVMAVDAKRSQKMSVEDTIHLVLTTQSGVTGTIDLSWSIHKEMDYYIAVFGTSGMLYIGWKGSRYRQSEKMEWLNFGEGYSKLQAFQDQITNFMACIDGRDKPLITGEDALESVMVIEAAYRSLKTDQWQDV